MRRIVALVGALLTTMGQTPAQMSSPAAPAGPPSGTQGLPSIRHLVYRFGYNTKAADSGRGTGTTTIDITGLAPDGGLMITATDDWWNTVNPRQSYSCEIHMNGNLECPKAPHAISPIQVTVVPLLAPGFFSGFASNPNATAERKYSVRATFVPAANQGFMGQVSTWNSDFKLSGAGTVPDSAPLVLIHSNGQMAQQSGRYIKANGKYNIVYDPRIKMPAIVNSQWTFVPRVTVNYYTVELRLINAGPQTSS